ncbi:MAG: hypothetical protein V2A58_07205 [Planctomycetota bacterium]
MTDRGERPRSVPLCPAWGLHVPLSYQRPKYKQISLENAVRVAIDEPASWGANYVDLYPSNKESAFPDSEDYRHRMWAQYAFKERPDDAQEHRWTIETFRAFNRRAHERGYLVAWFLHHKFPFDSREEWWRIVSSIHRELAEKVCDVCAQGWGAQVDGLGSEGHSVPPEKIPDLLWDEQPGLYCREASSVYDYAAPHHIRSYAFHLSDGRDHFYGGARWNKPPYPIEVYEGKPIVLRYGVEFVGCQAEARDLQCDDPGWGLFSAFAGADAVVEQMSNLYRAKMIAPREAVTTATWWINEPLISEKMRRYAFGVSQDPVRAAVAGELFTTAADGPFPRVAHPKGTRFIQNNYFRAYVRDNGRIELHADVAGRGNYTDFLETTRRLVTDELLIVDAGHTPPSSCHVECVEEAGAAAVLKVKVVYTTKAGRIEDDYRIHLVADSAVISIDVDRRCEGVPGHLVSRVGLAPCGELPSDVTDRWFGARGRFDSPVVMMRFRREDSQGRWTLASQHACILIKHGAAANERFGIDIALGDFAHTVPPSPLVNVGETVPNEERCDGACAVRVKRAGGGPYWVFEDGWWITRGAQRSRESPELDLVKIYLSKDHEARICSGGFLDGVIAPGWGCQYVLRFKDVEGDDENASATVRVEDVSPLIFAPRVKVPWPVAKVALDDEDWRYFDDEHVFLPNRKGEHRIRVQKGTPTGPRVIGTFASVRATRWRDDVFTVEAELPPWVEAVPEGYRFRMGLRWRGRELAGAQGAIVQRQGVHGDERWATLRFDPGAIRVRLEAESF